MQHSAVVRCADLFSCSSCDTVTLTLYYTSLGFVWLQKNAWIWDTGIFYKLVDDKLFYCIVSNVPSNVIAFEWFFNDMYCLHCCVHWIFVLRPFNNTVLYIRHMLYCVNCVLYTVSQKKRASLFLLCVGQIQTNFSKMYRKKHLTKLCKEVPTSPKHYLVKFEQIAHILDEVGSLCTLWLNVFSRTCTSIFIEIRFIFDRHKAKKYFGMFFSETRCI